jgi:hypothetical protein
LLTDDEEVAALVSEMPDKPGFKCANGDRRDALRTLAKDRPAGVV